MKAILQKILKISLLILHWFSAVIEQLRTKKVKLTEIRRKETYMTSNQIQYWTLQEQKRSNRVKERETERSNKASEDAQILRNLKSKEQIIAYLLSGGDPHSLPDKAQDLLKSLGLDVDLSDANSIIDALEDMSQGSIGKTLFGDRVDGYVDKIQSIFQIPEKDKDREDYVPETHPDKNTSTGGTSYGGGGGGHGGR